ncbi:MAG: type II toxin-antitoxin system RelE/ParE family toxin [Treponema sp.]|jgi:mRNA-degrading endonuclease YafQ of YafQ-DinJ toxin-antitoxin module|nr:type II toxin-antitoxin system RelE/ParE family toxin [Treponema sp.]
MQISQSNQFKKSYKKLFSNQLPETNCAINEIIVNPEIGEKKHGDLSWLRVHKYKMLGQLTLIGYTVENNILTFIAIGPHENFYRDIKR